MRSALDTLGMIVGFGLPVLLVLWWMRKPVSGAPRDAMASRAKASVHGISLLIWPTRAYHETLIDDASETASSVEDEQPQIR